MKILWFTWKDRKHPLAGGAEMVNEELAKRLATDGHEVIFLVGGFQGGVAEETINGYRIVRLGGRLSVYYQAYRYYKKNLKGWADLVIDEVNTMPFFCKFYVRERNIILCYQLCREIWFYQIFFPLSMLGYILEPVYLWLLRDRQVLTESSSTKNDLTKYGFKEESIHVFPVGLEQEPISEENFREQKKDGSPTLLYFGSIRSMKRPHHVLLAFEKAKMDIDDLKLVIGGSGNGTYAKGFLKMINNSCFADDITYLGRVSQEEKREIMRKAHVLCVTSIKEGWGLIITESNSCGTPAVVYDVDGLKDACKDGVTGLVCKKNDPEEMAGEVLRLLGDEDLYKKIRKQAYAGSYYYSRENSFQVFSNILKKIL